MNNFFSEGYGIIPKKVMRDKSISVYSKSVLAYMLSFTGGGRVECWPSIDTMAEDLCISRGSVIKAVEQLQERQYITKSRLFPNDPLKRANKYTLEWLYGSDVRQVNGHSPHGELSNEKGESTGSDVVHPADFRGSPDGPSTATTNTLGVHPADASINTINNTKVSNITTSTPDGIDPHAAETKAAVLATWNNGIRQPVPKVIDISPERWKRYKARVAEGMDFAAIVKMIDASDFLSGRTDRGTWTATFDWIVKSPTNWRKVMEGHYVNRRQGSARATAKSGANTDEYIARQEKLARERAANAQHNVEGF